MTTDVTAVMAWNATGAGVGPATLVELWDERVGASPEAPAVLVGGERVSFAELDRRAAHLAARLRALGVGPDTAVGVCVSRSVHLLVALVGVLKAGGAFVPLDPQYPAERLRYMVDDSGARLVIVDTELSALDIFCGDVTPVAVDREDGDGGGFISCDVAPENLAYIIYTSGSTGRPKGVAVRHSGIVNNLVDLNERFRIGPDDRVLALSALSFDMSVFELIGVPLGGAAVVLPEDGAEQDPGRWLDLVVEHRVTVWHSVPARIDLLLDEVQRGHEGAGSSIRLVLSGGDRLSVRLPPRVWNVLGSHVPVANIGGVTEVSIYSNHHAVIPADTRGADIPYGRPMVGQALYVVGDAGELVEPGVIGELWIGGVGLARGYVNRPGLTAQRFVADPFGPPAGLVYRTGDLARWRPDGCIELMGRADHQVKVRGFRVELGEIEVALRSHPLVDDCIVGVRESGQAGDQLAAYVVPAGGVPDDFVALLRKHVGSRLPAHMVPHAYAVLDRLPLTPNGKVDRAALKAMTCERPRELGRRTVPLSVREEIILALWRDILGTGDLAPNDDFFEAGGQSLLAIKSVSRLRAALGVPVALRTLFEAPTAAALARALDGEHATDAEPISPLPPGRDAVLSFGQERIWIYERLETGVPAYHVPVALSIDGALDIGTLERCLTEIVRRHEVLRAAIVVENGRARPVVRSVPKIVISVIDLTEDELGAAIDAEVRGPFSIEDGDLVRGVVLRTGERDVFLVTLHHLACDGWSIGLLIRELGVLYGDFTAGRASSLPEVRLQYADFAAWQRSLLSGQVLDRQLAYWRGHLAGMPALDLPLDGVRPPVATFVGGRVLFRLPGALVTQLRALCRQRGVTLFMGLLAGFQVLLGKYSGQSDIAVGTLVGGRVRPETEGLFGYFVNTLVLRTSLAGDPSWLELLDRVREVALGAYAHQDLPFERLVEELAPQRDLSRNPLFQVLFALHEPEPDDRFVDAVSRRELEARLGAARFDLAVDVTDLRDSVEVSMEFATDLFDRSTVERMGRHFVRVLDHLVTDAAARLSAMDILDHTEVAQTVWEWNRPAIATEVPTTLVAMWERQVAATPSAVAVVAGPDTVTFADLDRRAAALAAVLRAEGVGPESLVGVCLRRGADLIVALLGVLKAGGAYVPLDLGYPAERLAYMIADSGVRHVVCDAGGLAARPFPDVVRPVLIDQLDLDRVEVVTAGADSQNLAYVIYTSGSTGRPKGVAVTHANITSFLAWNQRVCGLSVRDRVLQNHSVAFDNSVWEIFQCLVSGAELHIIDAETGYDPYELARELSQRAITSFNATPSQMRILLDHAEDPERQFASLRLVFTGAEAVPADVARRLLDATGPDCLVFNEYGPTEATVTSAVCRITNGLLDAHAHRPSVPFGRPTDNARLYVLDGHLRPVVPGCRGLLYVGGQAVGRGYLNQPGRTASVFLPDPFAAVPGARMYATGDVVQLAADGNLVFLGREDHQVKLRGFRIELSEIETALHDHPLVGDCAVAVRRGVAGEPMLAAYVVLVSQASDDLTARLREHLATRLPSYMLPQAYTPIGSIPLTPNGKVDRDALPDPKRTSPSATRRAPSNEWEKLVGAAWRECLGLTYDVGLDDNFFDIGGNSLLVTEVAAWLSAELHRRVSPVLMFQHPTVAGLAECLSRSRNDAPEPVAAGATGGRRDRLNRMRGQRRSS